MNIIEVNSLTKLYKNGRGIKDITFTVEEGDIVGLLGPNGSGKTTTMKAILGLCRGNSGSITVFGKSIDEDFEEIMLQTGALIEAPAIFADMTAMQNMQLAARFYKNIGKDRIEQVLDAVHLLQYKNDKAGRFSLGMKQRLGLALAYLSNPKLIIMDEPVNGLDIEGMIETREIIMSLNKKYNTTFLISSHLSSEIEKTCNKVAVMSEGKLIDFTLTEKALELNPTLEDYYLRRVREQRRETTL